jgi:glycosyltransferase involved in cell wall biosynthesis
MTAPLVSVVIPAYNSARTVRQAIESALAQTVEDLDVIVVDDGSSDDSAAVAESVGDPRVRVVVQANGGAAAARNTGLAMATGKYVAFLDADDLWLPQKLAVQLDVLRAHPDVSAVQSGVINVDDELNFLGEERCTPSEDALLDCLYFRNMPGVMTTLVIERTKFEEMGCFDTALTILEEWDMTIKAARYCNMISIEEPLALYRVHPGNRSRNLDIHIAPGFRVLDGLFADPELPEHIRKRRRAIYARFYTMLSGGAFKVHRWRDVAKWGTKALVTDPRTAAYMGGMPIRHLRRRARRRQAAGSPVTLP